MFFDTCETQQYIYVGLHLFQLSFYLFYPLSSTQPTSFTASAQVAIRNGGRNGVGGTLGLKWILGGQHQKQEEQKPKNVL